MELKLKVQNPPAEGNENTHVTSGVPVTADTASDACNADNPVELSPENASVQGIRNPYFSPTGTMALRNGGNSCRNKSRAENDRRDERSNTDQKSSAVVDLTVEDDEPVSAGHESDGGELEDSEAEWDDGSPPTEILQNLCKGRRLRWSGRSSECVVPESKLKGKGKANNESATSSRGTSEVGRGKDRSKGSFDVRSSSSSPEVFRKTKSGRRIVSSDADDDEDYDQHTIPSGKKWKPDTGPSTRLRCRTTTSSSPNPTMRSGRPRRAAASNAVNYALLHEGQPLHNDYDDESGYEAQRRLSEGARRSRSEWRTKSKKRRGGFPEDNGDESDEWLELIEDGHGESAPKPLIKRNKHEGHNHNHDDDDCDCDGEEGVSHAELLHRQMMEDEQSDPDDPTISPFLR